MQVLWLKTLINMLYTFGDARQFDWHVWMHVLLAVSVILMVNQHPYQQTQPRLACIPKGIPTLPA